MPRRRIPDTSIPRRPDHRRIKGNATGAQRRRRGRRGQVEAIAERRAMALELRKSGAAYREIARQLGVDVHTAHGDVGAELAALREMTVGRAEELRALELERFDRMVAGLWPQIEKGSPPAVTAAIRVSERRARLLGLDAPVVTKNELTGALSVTAEKLAAERELFGKLDIQQMEELAAESQALVDKALAMVKANAMAPDTATALRLAVEHDRGSDVRRPEYTGADVARSSDGNCPFDPDRDQARRVPVLVAVSPSPAGRVDDVVAGKPVRETASTDIDDA
jgi:DNA-binding CsgD family transcriptional regulator